MCLCLSSHPPHHATLRAEQPLSEPSPLMPENIIARENPLRQYLTTEECLWLPAQRTNKSSLFFKSSQNNPRPTCAAGNKRTLCLQLFPNYLTGHSGKMRSTYQSVQLLRQKYCMSQLLSIKTLNTKALQKPDSQLSHCLFPSAPRVFSITKSLK